MTLRSVPHFPPNSEGIDYVLSGGTLRCALPRQQNFFSGNRTMSCSHTLLPHTNFVPLHHHLLSALKINIKNQ